MGRQTPQTIPNTLCTCTACTLFEPGYSFPTRLYERPKKIQISLQAFRINILFSSDTGAFYCEKRGHSTLSSLQINMNTSANSVDPDETARNEPSYQDIYCLSLYYWLLTKPLFVTTDVSEFRGG